MLAERKSGCRDWALVQGRTISPSVAQCQDLNSGLRALLLPFFPRDGVI